LVELYAIVETQEVKMKHICNWLVVFAKLLQFPFIAGLRLSTKKKNACLDLGDIGDNVPYALIK